jgi:hypothetical protein
VKYLGVRDTQERSPFRRSIQYVSSAPEILQTKIASYIHFFPHNLLYNYTIMKVLLLIPALAYLALIMINLQIFQQNTEINFFWLASFDIPVVIFVSIFFILYIILIWFGFNISNFFTGYKNKKLEKEVIDLKGKLLNKQ